MQPITDKSKYFIYAPERYPTCAACEVTILRIVSAYTVELTGDDLPIHPTGKCFVCRNCIAVIREGVGVDNVPSPCTIEELKKITNAEERINAREISFERDKKERAKEFRRERAKKAAATRAKNKKRSSSRDASNDRDIGSKSGKSGSKKVRNPKVRKVRGA